MIASVLKIAAALFAFLLVFQKVPLLLAFVYLLCGLLVLFYTQIPLVLRYLGFFLLGIIAAATFFASSAERLTLICMLVPLLLGYGGALLSRRHRKQTESVQTLS